MTSSGTTHPTSPIRPRSPRSPGGSPTSPSSAWRCGRMSHFDGPSAHWETWEYADTADRALAQLDEAYDAWSAGVAAPRRGGARPSRAVRPRVRSPRYALRRPRPPHQPRADPPRRGDLPAPRPLPDPTDRGVRMSRTSRSPSTAPTRTALVGFWNEALGYRYDAPRRSRTSPDDAWRRCSTTSGFPRRTATTPRRSIDPDGHRAAAVLPEGAGGKTAKNRRPPRRPGRPGARGRRADGGAREPSATGWSRSARRGCSAPSPLPR